MGWGEAQGPDREQSLHRLAEGLGLPPEIVDEVGSNHWAAGLPTPRQHLLEQLVIAAAVDWVELDPEAPSGERIRRARRLRESVANYREHVW